MLPTDLFSFLFLDSQILLSKGRQNGDWNNWFNNNLKAENAIFATNQGISYITGRHFLYFREKEQEYHFLLPPN